VDRDEPEETGAPARSMCAGDVDAARGALLPGEERVRVRSMQRDITGPIQRHFLEGRLVGTCPRCPRSHRRFRCSRRAAHDQAPRVSEPDPTLELKLGG
jgi:hypothetical protein